MFLPPHSYPYPRILSCSHPHRGGHRLVHSVPVPLCDLPPSSQETCWDHVHLRAVSWTQHFYSGCNMRTCLMLWENVCSSIAESGIPYLYIVHCIWLPMNCWICTSCEEFHNENLHALHNFYYFHRHGIVLGRCLVPIRVCTSPGRDRIVDEKKVNKETAEEEGEARSSRKRSLGECSV